MAQTEAFGFVFGQMVVCQSASLVVVQSTQRSASVNSAMKPSVLAIQASPEASQVPPAG
jgi:hypothetical protein